MSVSYLVALQPKNELKNRIKLNLQLIYPVHLISQLRLVFTTMTTLQIHQENITPISPTKITTLDIKVDKASIVNALESCLHLCAKCLVDLFIFRDCITDRFQSKEPENPPNFIVAIHCGYHLALETFQSSVGTGFIVEQICCIGIACDINNFAYNLLVPTERDW